MLLSAARGKAVKERMEGMQTHEIERNKSMSAVGFIWKGTSEILSSSFLRYRSPVAPQFLKTMKMKK